MSQWQNASNHDHWIQANSSLVNTWMEDILEQSSAVLQAGDGCGIESSSGEDNAVPIPALVGLPCAETSISSHP